jgi:hypothetical protein
MDGSESRITSSYAENNDVRRLSKFSEAKNEEFPYLNLENIDYTKQNHFSKSLAKKEIEDFDITPIVN